MSIEIRLLRKGEEELANAVYSRTSTIDRPLENFFWEFVEGPAGPAIYVVAVDTGKPGNPIIGTQAAIPIYWVNNNGSLILTGKSEDTYVDPEYRGQKLFDHMYNLLFEECRKVGIQIIWGFTYARKPFLKVGFEIPTDTIQGLFVNDIRESIKYLTSLNPANKVTQKFQIAALTILAKVSQQLCLIQKYKLPEEFSCEEKIVDKKQEFVQSSLIDKGQTVYDILQSTDYNNWRFKNNPFKNNYFELNYHNDEKWVASVLYNLRPEGFAYIEQMYFAPTLSKDQRCMVISNAVLKISQKKPFLIRFWGFDKNSINKQETELLKKRGFLFVKKGTGIVWKNLQPPDTTSKIKFEQVHFSRIYTQGNI